MRDTPDPERATLEAQTQRNLQGMELERGGDQDAAIELYEQNLREAFEADWPYGRLVAIYERRGRPQDAIRVLQRGMEVFKASKRRTPQDRRAVISIFRNRIREIERKQQAAARGAAFQARVAAREAAARDRQAAREAAARERAARREAAAQARAAKSG